MSKLLNLYEDLARRASPELLLAARYALLLLLLALLLLALLLLAARCCALRAPARPPARPPARLPACPPPANRRPAALGIRVAGVLQDVLLTNG